MHRYRQGWSADLGLWHDSIPHLPGAPRKHVIRANAWRLVAAGLDGLLDQVPTERVLRNLRAAQAANGNFWWYWEDGRVTDTNSGFFTGLGLIVLRHEFGPRPLLDEMLRDVRRWFVFETEPLREEKLRYPNKCLGDLVCRWLLAEMFGEINDHEIETLATGLAYYRDRDWGWGEHLSDLYAKVCLDEFVALLAYAKQLPATLRTQAEGLVAELNAIDAAFAGGPRVPTIRCYQMDESPRTPTNWGSWFQPYAAQVAPWDGTGKQILMAAIAHRRGLAPLFAGNAAVPAVEVPCFAGTRALADVTPTWRLGVMSRYPLMPGVDHPRWGLHWQTMPVAFHHQRGDWAYLQWLATEADDTRGLPAMSRAARRSCVLSDAHPDAAVGHTTGERVPGGFQVRRELRAIAPTWANAADRLRWVNPTVSPAPPVFADGWWRLDVRFPDMVLTVAAQPLEGFDAPVLTHTGKEWAWTLPFQLSAARAIADWRFTIQPL